MAIVTVLVLLGIMVLWALLNPAAMNILLLGLSFVGRLLFAVLFVVLQFVVLIWLSSRPRVLKWVKSWISLLVDREKLDQKLEKLPTRDEVMGELKIIREEQTVLSHRFTGHEERLSALEKNHPAS